MTDENITAAGLRIRPSTARGGSSAGLMVNASIIAPARPDQVVHA